MSAAGGRGARGARRKRARPRNSSWRRALSFFFCFSLQRAPPLFFLPHNTLPPSFPNPLTCSAAAPLPRKANWEDEEEEDQTVKELKTAPSAAASAAPAPAQPQKIKDKHIEKAKQREREGKGGDGSSSSSSTLCANCQAELHPLADPAAEKKRLEALAIKADIAAAQALMGTTTVSGGSTGSGAGAAAAGSKAVLPTDAPTLVAAISLLSGDAFRDLGKLVANRVHEASGKANALAVRFYNELLLTGGEKLKVEELAALSKVIDAIRNKKLQEEKSKKPGGGSKTKGAKVRVGADLDGESNKPHLENSTLGREDEPTVLGSSPFLSQTHTRALSLPAAYDDYGDDYGDVATGSAAAASAAAPATGGVAGSTGNSGNVDLSVAAAGLSGSVAAGVDDKFQRQRFAAEDDFM